MDVKYIKFWNKVKYGHLIPTYLPSIVSGICAIIYIAVTIWWMRNF